MTAGTHIASGSAAHLLGIGGAGMSGAARLLVARGVRVSGHDRSESATLDALRALGIAIETGVRKAEPLPAAIDVVVRSAAVPLTDPACQAAAQRGIPVLKYAQVLAQLAPAERTLAVAGTHGKTTTAWLALHARRALDPGAGCLIGGTCEVLESNALAPAAAGAFVVEACEYDRSFLELVPNAAAITNVEADHLECYGSLAGLLDGFAQFARRVAEDGLLVLGERVPLSIESAARCPVWRLGRDLVLENVASSGGFYRFDWRSPAHAITGVQLAIPGRFNADNAALALALALQQGAGFDAEIAARGLARYRGALRRFERWGDVGGRTLIHDYAHHPTELVATLTAAREVFAGRSLQLLFQPHQFSRTRQFLAEFAAALKLADHAVVCDIYGARAESSAGPQVSALELVEAAHLLGASVVHGGPLRGAAEMFACQLPENAVGFVVGAGDIEQVKDDLLRELSVRAPALRTAGR